LCEQTVTNGNRMEQSALSRCRLAIYSSHWAARTAKTNYLVDTSKIKVVPFGPSLEVTRDVQEIDRMVRARGQGLCKLLFVGVQWYRKGGDIAVELARNLDRLGVKVQLTIVGCNPPTSVPDFVSEKGFLGKTSRNGQSVLTRYFAESHFL